MHLKRINWSNAMLPGYHLQMTYSTDREELGDAIITANFERGLPESNQ